MSTMETDITRVSKIGCVALMSLITTVSFLVAYHKQLLLPSDDSLSAEDVALGYKQSLEVERGFRTLKITLKLRPVYHRKDDRIKADVLLCFLALLLTQIVERRTGLTWDRLRATMERLHLGEFESKTGRILQRTELTSKQSNILKRLNVLPPPKVYKVDLKG